MPTWLWIVLILLAVVVIGVVLLARKAARGVDPTEVTIDPELAAEVTALGMTGKLPQAVALLHQRTGMSVVNSRLVVTRLVKRADGKGAGGFDARS